MREKLLVLELWGIGDLAIASPFLQAASRAYDVTLLAKPHARELQQRFWPDVNLIPFTAPWTAFRGKYRLCRWPWAELSRLVRQLRAGQFAVAASARRDPRDAVLLHFSGARRRVGF
ncbi:MAG: hypothetical protein AB1705_26520, partial [Verrucomicrobiota bacterium]